MEFKEIVKSAYYYDKSGMLLFGDCLDWMPKLPDKSVDMILADLPYGSTSCKWDIVIPFKSLWKQYERIIKDDGAIVLTASQPFTSYLLISNIKIFRHHWIWKKRKAGNFQLAKRQPLKVTEDILVFGKKPVKYYPIPRELPQSSIDRRKYKIESKVTNLEHMSSGNYKFENNMGDGFGYPFNIIEVGQEVRSLHATQKPVALFEYLIKTYTLENEIILDNTAGVCTTAIASKNLNRKWICIEKEEKYCEISKERIKNHKKIQ